MKIIIIFGMLSFLMACNQPEVKTKTQLDQQQKKQNNEIEIINKNSDSTKIEFEKIYPFKQSYAQSELETLYFVSDTILNDFSKIMGTVENWSNDLRTMTTNKIDDSRIEGVFSLNDSIRIIPFLTGWNSEDQIFTKWKINPDLTYSYIGRYKPDFSVKYSFANILQMVKINNQDYFIGKTIGGEGGEIWSSLWTAKLLKDDSLSVIIQYSTGYEADKKVKSISYQINDEIISIFLNTDSLRDTRDSTILIPLDKEFIKEVDIKKNY